MTKRILLLSAYDALSHRHWREALAGMFPDYAWTQLALPPRNFSWRVRSNSLSWGFNDRTVLQQRFDLLIATSLVDLASLRGFVPGLAQLPTIVYFHENQFAYPRSPAQQSKAYDTNLDAALVSLYAALCADRVVFNSAYNRETFLRGTEHLLARFPDHVPAGIMTHLARARTIPVPLPALPAGFAAGPRRCTDTLEVAWNHRWEYDKGPGLLLALIRQVIDDDLPIRFHIMGQQFRRHPGEFAQLAAELSILAAQAGGPIAHLGYLPDRRNYLEQLASCDVVLSTAAHDFQGLAILEGCALGCTPLCPAQLVYPEYLDPQFLYPPASGSETTQSLPMMVAKLRGWLALKLAGKPLPTFTPQRFSHAVLKESYLELFRELWRES